MGRDVMYLFPVQGSLRVPFVAPVFMGLDNIELKYSTMRRSATAYVFLFSLFVFV